MTDLSIYGYKMVSNAVNALKNELGIKQILHEGSHYKGAPYKTVINYGSSNLPGNVLRSRIINKPTSVALCVDMLAFFSHLYEIDPPVETPFWTNNPNTAKAWINEENKVLVARTILTGKSGQGIKILRKGLDFIAAPLYTIYIPKQYEYRVHVINGEVIDIQRKVLQKDTQLKDEEKKIRSHNNGWIFTRTPELLKIPGPMIEEQAKRAVKYMDLDFGAVDIIWSKTTGKATVLEVNSAPGQEGATTKTVAF